VRLAVHLGCVPIPDELAFSHNAQNAFSEDCNSESGFSEVAALLELLTAGAMITSIAAEAAPPYLNRGVCFEPAPPVKLNSAMWTTGVT